jgi:hypothetical protein
MPLKNVHNPRELMADIARRQAQQGKHIDLPTLEQSLHNQGVIKKDESGLPIMRTGQFPGQNGAPPVPGFRPIGGLRTRFTPNPTTGKVKQEQINEQPESTLPGSFKPIDPNL